MSTVHVVVPAGIDDSSRPSGGNVYDRQIIGGLAGLGWTVHERRVDELDRILDGELVLVDGLLTSEGIAAHTERLRLVALVHMPLDTGQERSVLSAVAAVVTTSRWTRQWLLETYELPGDRVHVVEPGAEIADLAPGTPSGGELLCVGAVRPNKGQDVLVDALAAITDLDWHCVCAGSLDIAPDFVADLRPHGERLDFTGPLTSSDLDIAYAGADLLVSASRAETYGMAVTEALARGLPVLATEVGGVSEALGRTEEGELPGVLVPPEDPEALAKALRHWLSDPGLRKRLRKAAQSRRLGLTDWSHTSMALSRVLDEVSDEPSSRPLRTPDSTPD
jgi:glycosyltransferase involved in cell wall biosynthesis